MSSGRAGSRFRRLAARKIFKLGGLFFVLQLAAALAFASDNLVAAHVIGAASVAEYSVTMQLFSLPTLILGTLFLPLWPAYGEAVTRGDFAWVERTLKRSLLLAVVVAGIPSVVLILAGRPIVQWWAGSSLAPSFLLLLGLGIWAVLQATGNAVAMFLNGASVVRLQVICASLLALVGLAAKITLARRWGLPGIAWANGDRLLRCRRGAVPGCRSPDSSFAPRNGPASSPPWLTSFAFRRRPC